MAAIHIIQYRAGWDIKGSCGRIQLRSQKGTWSPVKSIKDSTEFQVILDLLRNEHPIFYDIKNDVIRTSIEPVGENE